MQLFQAEFAFPTELLLNVVGTGGANDKQGLREQVVCCRVYEEIQR